METFGKYVSRVMEEKNLTALDVEARASEAGHKITDTYVTNIIRGVNRNLSVEKLQALAVGLDIDAVELFKVAIGAVEEGWTATDIARATQKLVSLKPKEIRQIKRILKME
jgi:transcriptional regulator with XRE-family HTH domain